MDDDHFSSDFPFQITDDLFQFTCSPLPQHTISPSNEISLIPSYQPGAGSLLNNQEFSQWEMAQKSSNDFTEGDPEHSSDQDIEKFKEKKASHKEIEKQRRQEMSALYRSLRTLLPIEYLKGRRSISDHIHESANYIKHLKNNIKELSNNRDQLKRLKSSHILEGTSDKEPFSEREYLENVRVTPSWPGIEVAAETDLRHGIPLSRIVQVLVEEGLSVASCVSTKVNGRFLHTIKTEVMKGMTKDLFKLQHKLANLLI